MKVDIETEYAGLSVRFSANLHTAKMPIRIDIGFSDEIFPEPAKVTYPTLLDLPSPELRGYTPETTIAEKLDAMIRLGFVNTRMKDFYDIWVLLRQFDIKPQSIKPVIKQVFQNRKTIVQSSPVAFSEDFYKMSQTKDRWKAFLKGIGHKELSFEEVVKEIRDFFLPILKSI